MNSNLDNLMNYAQSLGCVCAKDEPMSSHTSFGIGGPADLFIVPPDERALEKIIHKCREWDICVTIVGGGTNLLVSDNGIEGVVLSTSALSSISIKNNEIECGAGAKLMALCTLAKDNNLSGLEFAYGIPGTAGGAVYMNAGAYGGEMSGVLLSARHIDEHGQIGEFNAGELNLGYRTSVYSGGSYTILSAKLRLEPGSSDEIAAKMADFMNRRLTKQPYEARSAGSVFKRPPGQFAGSLIEQCGLKGRQAGGAMVSDKHAGFIINAGGATCEDVMNLVDIIQREVLTQTGFILECEIKRIGR